MELEEEWLELNVDMGTTKVTGTIVGAWLPEICEFGRLVGT